MARTAGSSKEKRTRTQRLLTAAVAGVATVAATHQAIAAPRLWIELASVSSTGAQADRDTYVRGLSRNGRFVVFDSWATTLDPAADGSKSNVFLRDRHHRTTQAVVLPVAGTGPLDGQSYGGGVSADGRYVVFDSGATNVVPDDRNGAYTDVFLRDMLTGTVEIISVTSEEVQLVSASGSPAITPDGRYVVFHSGARLAPEDTNEHFDVYVRDRLAGTTELVSAPLPQPDPPEGGLLDPILGADDPAPRGSDGFSGFADISDDGNVIAFQSRSTRFDSSDTSDELDIYVADRAANTIERASVSTAGDGANSWSTSASVSADGSVIAFESAGWNLAPGGVDGRTDIYLRRLGGSPSTERVSVDSDEQAGSGWSRSPSISGDGRYVAFESNSRLSTDDPSWRNDIFLRDLVAGTTSRMSGDAAHGDGVSVQAYVSDAGVAFDSSSTDLVRRDTNGVRDTFFRRFGR